MPKTLLFQAGTQFTDLNGVPLAGGFIYVYTNRQTTLKTVYSTAAGGSSSNPITLDSKGRTSALFVDANSPYSVIITDSKGTAQQTLDDVFPITNTLYATAADGTITPAMLSTSLTANRAIGTNGSGEVGEVAAGSNMSVSSGVLNYTGAAETKVKRLLYSGSFSGTTLDLSTYFDAGSYDIYEIRMRNVVSAGATELKVQLRESSSFLTGSGYSNRQYAFYPTSAASDSTITHVSGSLISGTNAQDGFYLNYDTSTSVNGSVLSFANSTTSGLGWFDIDVFPAATNYPAYMAEGMYLNGSGLPITVYSQGVYTSSSPTVDGFKILGDGSWSAEIMVFGLPNS